MRTKFPKGEKGQVYALSDLRKGADHWGKRDLKQPPVGYNNTWQISWYAPGAWSSPHRHWGSESVYYFHFAGEGGEAQIYLGWPLSKARLTKITEPTIVHIPTLEAHCFSNTGKVDMILIHAFSPPWEEDLGVEIDLTDAETNKTYKKIDEYADHVREGDEKYGTLEGYIEYLKKIGKY